MCCIGGFVSSLGPSSPRGGWKGKKIADRCQSRLSVPPVAPPLQLKNLFKRNRRGEWLTTLIRQGCTCCKNGGWAKESGRELLFSLSASLLLLCPSPSLRSRSTDTGWTDKPLLPSHIQTPSPLVSPSFHLQQPAGIGWEKPLDPFPCCLCG